MDKFPEFIILQDQDGGFTVGKLDKRKFIMTSNNSIPVYEYVEYYHALDSAARKFDGKTKQED